MYYDTNNIPFNSKDNLLLMSDKIAIVSDWLWSNKLYPSFSRQCASVSILAPYLTITRMLDPLWRQGGEKSIHPTAALCGRDVTVCAIHHHPLHIVAVNCYRGHVLECNSETMKGFYRVSAIQRRHAKVHRVYLATRKLRLIARKPMFIDATEIDRNCGSRASSLTHHVSSRWIIINLSMQINVS